MTTNLEKIDTWVRAARARTWSVAVALLWAGTVLAWAIYRRLAETYLRDINEDHNVVFFIITPIVCVAAIAYALAILGKKILIRGACLAIACLAILAAAHTPGMLERMRIEREQAQKMRAQEQANAEMARYWNDVRARGRPAPPGWTLDLCLGRTNAEAECRMLEHDRVKWEEYSAEHPGEQPPQPPQWGARSAAYDRDREAQFRAFASDLSAVDTPPSPDHTAPQPAQ